MAWRTLTLRLRLTLAVLLVVTAAMAAQPLFVLAGPVTSPGAAPYTKIGVYQGLLTIAPARLCVGGANPGVSCPIGNECTGVGAACTPSSVLEIGNAGRDIAGSGEIYLRPGGLSRSVGVKFLQYIPRQCVGGTNAGTMCPNGNECLGGGSCVAQPAKTDLFMGGGNLCIGSISASTCQSNWVLGGGAGDTYWQEVSTTGITALRPSLTNAPTVGIRIGRESAGIPSASGRAFEVYGSGSTGSATCTAVGSVCSTVASISGSLRVGQYFDTPTPYFTGGNVYVNGNIHVTNPDFTYGAVELGDWEASPYHSLDRYNPVGPYEGSIDADMFDSASVLPFKSKFCVGGTNAGTTCPNGNECTGGGSCRQNDLIVLKSPQPLPPGWQPWMAIPTTDKLCLRTSDTKLCAGGTVNSNAGTPCPNGNECTGGATCAAICAAEVATCAVDPAVNAENSIPGYLCNGGANNNQTCPTLGFNTAACPNGTCTAKRCAVVTANDYVPGPQPCTTSNDCSSKICIRGKWASQGGYNSSFCAGLTCADICKFNYVERCNGTLNAGVCSSYGDIPRYTTGDTLDISTTFYGACTPDNVTPTYNLQCDCFLENPVEYYQALPPGSSGGLLCTKTFTNPSN